jgi:limonene-1,2-epoxide hydrolase
MVARMSETEGTSASRARAASASPIAVVESFFRALEALDLPRALEHLGDDVVYQNYPLPPDRGRAAVERTLRLFARVCDHFEVRMTHIAERDGVVLTERTDVIRGPGLDLELWVCGTLEVRDGKIVLWRDRFDTAGFALQLLASPARWLLRRRRTTAEA